MLLSTLEVYTELVLVPITAHYKLYSIDSRTRSELKHPPKYFLLALAAVFESTPSCTVRQREVELNQKMHWSHRITLISISYPIMVKLPTGYCEAALKH